jgi:acetyl esterase/lipase
MSLDALHPDLHEPLKRTQVRLPLPVIRVAMRFMPVPRSAAVRVRTVKGGGLDLRVYEPVGRRSGAGLLWVHGGGLLFGHARQDEALCLSTAERLGLTIVSANYRLAPRHPFPAPHDDLHLAWRWLHQRAHDLGTDPGRLAIGGESAGAGLAAGLVQRLHDDDGPRPAAQWLFAPMIDDRTAARRDLDATPYPVWDNTKNRQGWGGFLGSDPGTVIPQPYAVPARREDLTGLPTFLTWCDGELFAAEDERYADALAADGVPVTTDVVVGGAHGFENWAHDTPLAQGLITRAQDWLAGTLGVAVEHDG